VIAPTNVGASGTTHAIYGSVSCAFAGVGDSFWKELKAVVELGDADELVVVDEWAGGDSLRNLL
jgi:hypothetical protein